MLDEVVDRLVEGRGGTYIDATVGGGTAAAAIVDASCGCLIGLDRDPEAIRAASERLVEFGGRVLLFRTEFWNVREVLSRTGVEEIDGVLFDLGLSSHQLDASGRGFSYRRREPLDMRMDPGLPRTAFHVINEYPEQELTRMFLRYGEERFASRIAREICTYRSRGRIRDTAVLREIVERVIPRKKPQKTLSRIFQAIRIEVNDELTYLEESIRQAVSVLKPEGRIAVISYHSLEDRIAKTVFSEYARGCICPPGLPVCICGKQSTLSKMARVFPSSEEIVANPRARSAVLRVARKKPVHSPDDNVTEVDG